MNTLPNESSCPRCGKPVSLNAFEGLCPECLLQAGFGTITGGPGEEKFSAFVPPTPEELARHFSQLEIIELLGRGGMGAVYKARQIHLDRIVALKILPPTVSQAPAFAERFVREARALAKLHHPNIVTLYESGQADDLFYFLMEFVDGVNLRQLLSTGTISAKDALAIVPQICDALQFAHDRGIVHRDIKPENILLSKTGQVKIADFGVAKIVAGESAESPSTETSSPAESQTELGKVIGTPQYMAPEQLSHPLDVDNRADIYALGVVFYQMLTGELPVGKFGPPSSKVQIDVRLDDIVLRALQKQPELRYQQASVMKTQVETIAGTPRSPTPATAGIRAPSPPRPNSSLVPVLRWLLVAFAVFILTVPGGAFLTYQILPKIYTATAQIQVRPQSGVSGGAASTLDPTAFQAEFEIMQSPDVLLPIIKDLNLDQIWAKRLHKSPPDALPPLDALGYLIKNLRLEEKRGTNIIEISASSEVPREAADIANAVADHYKTLRDVQEHQRNSRGQDALRAQIDLQRQVVDETKARLEAMRAALGQKGSAVGADTSEADATDLDARKKALLAAQEDSDARRVLLASVINLPDDQFIATLKALGRSQTEIDRLVDDIATIKNDITNLLKDGFVDNHPRIQAMRAEMAAKQQVVADLIAGVRRAMKVDADMAQSRVELLQKEVSPLTTKLSAGDEQALAPYRAAQHELAQQQSLLDALNVRIKQVIADSQLLESPVRIVTRAEPSAYPSSPNSRLNLLLSVLAGFVLGIVVASLLELVLWLCSSSAAASGNGQQIPVAPNKPDSAGLAMLALFSAGLSGVLGTMAFYLMPGTSAILDAAIWTAALLGILLGVLSRNSPVGKAAIVIGSINLAIALMFATVWNFPANSAIRSNTNSVASTQSAATPTATPFIATQPASAGYPIASVATTDAPNNTPDEGRLYHAVVYQQTSATGAKLAANPYQFIADIRNTVPHSTGTVSLPPGATWPANPVPVAIPENLLGAHFLFSQGFGSMLDLLAHFPNGNYSFNITRTYPGDVSASYSTPPIAFTDSTDLPPSPPSITNTTWNSGTLLLQPGSAVINYQNYPGALMTWEVVAKNGSAGGGGTSIGSLNLTGLLQPGQTYQAQLRFIRPDSSVTINDRGANYTYSTLLATIVQFTITTPPSGPAPSPDDKETQAKKYETLFTPPPTGTFGQLGMVMEIHASFSRQLAPGVIAVHYFSQYRGFDAGVSWGGEIAVYGLPASFVEGSSWKGLAYPAGHMTFGTDRLSVYSTTKEQAITLLESEPEKDRRSFPP